MPDNLFTAATTGTATAVTAVIAAQVLPEYSTAHKLGSESGERFLRSLAGEAASGAATNPAGSGDAMGAMGAMSTRQALAALVLAAKRHGYDHWVTAKTQGFDEPAARAARDVGAEKPEPGQGEVTMKEMEKSLAVFFDSMLYSNWDPKDLVWFARSVPADQGPHAHEWGIWPGIVGIALPDALSAALLKEAQDRNASFNADHMNAGHDPGDRGHLDPKEDAPYFG